MKTIDELQQAINGLIPLMLDKGIVRPEAIIRLKSNQEGGVYLSGEWRDSDAYDPENVFSRWFPARVRPDGLDPWDGAVQDARGELLALPNKPEREREEFLKLLARTTEYGRKVGIEEEFVNPLQVLAKKLSEGALAPPKDFIRLHVGPEAQKALDKAPKADDWIPF